jgi:hypothetical protein
MNDIVETLAEICWIVLRPYLVIPAFVVAIFVFILFMTLAIKFWSLFLWLFHRVWDEDLCNKHRELVGDAKFKGWYTPSVISQTTVLHNVLYNGDHGKQCVVTFVGLYSIPEEFRNGLLAGSNVRSIPPSQSPYCLDRQEVEEYWASIVDVDGEHQLDGSNPSLSASDMQSVSIFVPYDTAADAILGLDK